MFIILMYYEYALCLRDGVIVSLLVGLFSVCLLDCLFGVYGVYLLLVVIVCW